MFPVILLLKDERIALKLRSFSQSGERLFHDVSDNFNRFSKNVQEIEGKDSSHIHRCSNRKWILLMCTVGNL